MNRGQIWSLDLSVSLVIFIAACLIAYTILNNAFIADQDALQRQAEGSGAILVGEGYPAHWTNDTVIRAGLAADGQLSLRKARDLALLSNTSRRAALRATDDVAILFINSTGEVIPFTGSCALGDVVVSDTLANRTLDALAITNGGHPVADGTAITQVGDSSAFDTLLTREAIIVEANLTLLGVSDTMVLRAFSDAARRGVTIIVIGNPGIGILGINASAVPADELIAQPGKADLLGFAPGATVNFSSTTDVTVITPPAGADVTGYEPLLLASGGEVAGATWLYHDARIWYIGTTGGEHAGTPFADTLAGSITQNLTTVTWPACDSVTMPDADQLAHHDRTLPYGDQLITIRTIVWSAR